MPVPKTIEVTYQSWPKVIHENGLFEECFSVIEKRGEETVGSACYWTATGLCDYQSPGPRVRKRFDAALDALRLHRSMCLLTLQFPNSINRQACLRAFQIAQQYLETP